ncbi:MAG: hypothetical protein J6Z17_01905 [Treponema sp.]|nr:hypothetical protein [Treponema sp.]
MELRVNGNKIDITLENEKTVGEVLKAFENEAAKNNATTVSIKLNGNDVSADGFEEACKEPVKDDTLLELSVVSKSDITLSLKESSAKFLELSQKLKDVSVLLQTSREKEANEIIKLLADEISTFCHTATLSALFPDVYEKLSVDGTDAGTFFKEFSPLLSDFEKALQEKDSVTVGDLSEYEISPRLEKLASSAEEASKA